MSAPGTESFPPLLDPEGDPIDAPELSDTVTGLLRGAVSMSPPEVSTSDPSNLTDEGQHQKDVEDALVYAAGADLRVETAQNQEGADDNYVNGVIEQYSDQIYDLADAMDEDHVPFLAHAAWVVNANVQDIQQELANCPWWKFKQRDKIEARLADARQTRKAVMLFLDGFKDTRSDDLLAVLEADPVYQAMEVDSGSRYGGREDDDDDDEDDDDDHVTTGHHTPSSGDVHGERSRGRLREFGRRHRTGIVIGALAVAGVVAYKAGAFDAIHNILPHVVQQHGGGRSGGGAGTAAGGHSGASTGNALAGNNGLEQVTAHPEHLQWASGSNANHILHYVPGSHGESIIRLQDISPTGSVINGHAIDLNTAHGLYAQITVTGNNGTEQLFNIPLQHVDGHIQAVIPQHLEKIFNVQNHNVAVDIRMNGGHGATDVFTSGVSNGHHFSANQIHALDHTIHTASSRRGGSGYKPRRTPYPIVGARPNNWGTDAEVAVVAGGAGALLLGSRQAGVKLGRRRARRRARRATRRGGGHAEEETHPGASHAAAIHAPHGEHGARPRLGTDIRPEDLLPAVRRAPGAEPFRAVPVPRVPVRPADPIIEADPLDDHGHEDHDEQVREAMEAGAALLLRQRVNSVNEIFRRQGDDDPDATEGEDRLSHFDSPATASARIDAFVESIQHGDPADIEDVINYVRAQAADVTTGRWASLLRSPDDGGTLDEYLDIITELVNERLNPTDRRARRAPTLAAALIIEAQMLNGRTASELYDYLTSAPSRLTF